MSDSTAILSGYTRELIGAAGTVEIHIFAKPDADLGDTFHAYDADECEFINIKGWLWSFEPV